MSQASSAEELRRAFDAAFAVEPAAPPERVDLIALRAGASSLAVRASEIGGVAPLRAVASLPCREPCFVGVAAVGGAPLPVYDLAALLGQGPSASPRWLLLSAGPERMALAFHEIEAYLRVPREQVVPAPPSAPGALAPAELVREAGGGLRPVVSIEAALSVLRARFGAPRKGEP